MPTLPPQIVLLGDSLFEMSVALQDGYSLHADLQAYYIRRYDVVNRGFSGYNTKNIVHYLDQIIQPPSETVAQIKYLAVLLGANDAVLDMPSTIQHVPIDAYRANLKTIITHPNIVAHNPTIILVTPPPLDEIRATELDLAQGHPKCTRTAVNSAAYSQVVRDVAVETPGVKLVDLWKGIMDKAIGMDGGSFDYSTAGAWLGDPKSGKQGGLKTLLPDGLHMNADAYKVFRGLLGEHLPEVQSEREARTDYVFPIWSVINGPQK